MTTLCFICQTRAHVDAKAVTGYRLFQLNPVVFSPSFFSCQSLLFLLPPPPPPPLQCSFIFSPYALASSPHSFYVLDCYSLQFPLSFKHQCQYSKWFICRSGWSGWMWQIYPAFCASWGNREIAWESLC